MMVLPVVLAVVAVMMALINSLRSFIRSYLLGTILGSLIPRVDSIILALPEDYFMHAFFKFLCLMKECVRVLSIF